MRLVLPSEERVDTVGGALVVGSSEKCDVRIEGAAPDHVRIEGGDLEAIAACDVGEVPLQPGERRRLVPGCSVDLGAAVRLWVEAAEASSFTTRELALRAVAEPKKLWPAVIVVQGASVGRELVLREDRTYAVGRSSTGDLALDDVDVSRAHVEIIRRGEAVLVRDLGSTRGTLLGRTRLEPRRKALWTPETMVKVGKTVLALDMPSWTRRPSQRAKPALQVDPAAASTADDATPSATPDDDDIPDDGGGQAIPSSGGAGGAIAAVPAGLPPPAPRRRAALEPALFVGIGLIVILAIAGLVWVLWP